MRIAILLLTGLIVSACSGVEIKPGEVSHSRREMPPGPGLLSGSDGEFLIYRQGALTDKEGLPDEGNGPGDE